MSALPLVRLAQPEDEDEILEMCRRLHQENGLFTLNLEKVRGCLHRCFHRSGTIVGVIGLPGRIEASTCLEITTFYYTDDLHLAELWNFVDAPYRVSRNAEALVQFGKSCAEQLKMPFFTGIITNRRLAGKARLYRRLLGYPAGAFFVHNSNWVSEPMDDYTEIRARLRETADLCATTKVPRRTLANLLREAAKVIGGADNLWGTKGSKSNDASAA